MPVFLSAMEKERTENWKLTIENLLNNPKLNSVTRAACLAEPCHTLMHKVDRKNNAA